MTPIEQKAAEAVAIYLNPDLDEASKYVAMARVMEELQAMFREAIVARKIEQREQFEKWAKDKFPSASLELEVKAPEIYFNYFVQAAWEGWQGALASHIPSGCPMAEPTCPMEKESSK